MPLSEDEIFQRGVHLFNAGEFFEAHEVLEDIWGPSRGEVRFFLQALIHLAVAFHHHGRGNRPGAERQLRKGLKKLAGYLPQYRNVNTITLYEAARDALDRILRGETPEPLPRIRAL